jgi:hypothetical protein
MSQSPTGPISQEQMQALAESPAFGVATAELRKHDPFWGRADGEKIRWRVTIYSKALMKATAFVEASSEDEANKLADAIEDSSLDWDAVGNWLKNETWVDEVVPV